MGLKNIKIDKNDGIVLLHGLCRSSLSMRYLEKKIKKSFDFDINILNLNYPSRKYDIKELSYMVFNEIKGWSLYKKCKKLHFVTHSMGGILLRYHRLCDKTLNIGRVVMLAPPNSGSDIVKMLGKIEIFNNFKPFKLYGGEAGLQLGSEYGSFVNQMDKKVDFEVGIIAGRYDKKVSIESTKLENMKDFKILSKTHGMIMFGKDSADSVITFLKYGAFTIRVF